MDISVIIPVYNYGHFIPHMLERLIACTIPEGVSREVLVVDNDSTDNTAEVVNRFSEQYPFIRCLLEKVRGRSSAMNTAIRHAQGSILLFTDADVLVDKLWIATYWEFFQNTEVRIAMGKVLLDGELHDLPEWVDPANLPYFNPLPPPKNAPELLGANFAARKEVFEQHDVFLPFLGAGTIGFCEDTEFGRRLMAKGIEIRYLHEAVVYHEIIPHRLTRKYQFQRHYEICASLTIMKIMVDRIKPPPLRHLYQRWLRCRIKSVLYKLTGNYAQEKKYTLKTAKFRGMLTGRRMAKSLMRKQAHQPTFAAHESDLVIAPAAPAFRKQKS